MGAIMPGRNFSLTDHLSQFVDDQVDSGRHQNASEVIREALRRYQHEVRMEQAQIQAIIELVKEGRDAKARGDFAVIDGPEDEARLIEEVLGRTPEWLVKAPALRG